MRVRPNLAASAVVVCALAALADAGAAPTPPPAPMPAPTVKGPPIPRVVVVKPTADAGADVPCTIVLTGAVSGSYACAVHAAAWTSATNQSTVAFTYGAPSPTSTFVSVGAVFTGAPAARAYAPTEKGTSGTSVVMAPGASFAASSPGGPGTWSMTLTSATPTTTVDGQSAVALGARAPSKRVEGGKIYVVHGTFDATLVEVGAARTVTAHVSF